MRKLKNIFEYMYDYDDFVRHIIPHYTEMQAHIVRALHLNPDTKYPILDLGCGTGQSMEIILMLDELARVIGMDNAPTMLSKANERLSFFSSERWTLQEGDIISAPYPQGMHGIISFAVCNNFPPEYLNGIYQKIYGALLPGGRFVHADFIRNEDPAMHLELEHAYRLTVEQNIPDPSFLAWWFGEGENHYYPCTLSTHFSCLKEAGFTDIQLEWRQGNQAIFSARKPSA